MKVTTFIKAAVLTLALTGLGPAMAQDQLRTQEQDMLRLRDQMPGYDYMTQRERDTYMERMRSINSMREGGVGGGAGAGPASRMNGQPPILLRKKGGARR